MFLIKRSCTTLSSNILPSSRLKPSSPLNLSYVNLTGRDFLNPLNLTCDEIKSLLWTAIDLKLCKKQLRNEKVKLNNARVSLLLQKPALKAQFSIRNAARVLNANVNTFIDNYGDYGENYVELGRMLTAFSDIIFCKNDEQARIQEIADGAHVPVIAIRSYQHSIIQCLADLMSLQEHYNHLKGLKFCYIGLNGPLINSYLCLLPRFGIDINYYCVDKGANCISPYALQTGMNIGQQTGAEIHEYTSIRDAIYRCDVIATSLHEHDKLQIKRKHVQDAAVNWTLLDTFPRGKEVESEIYRHDNCLTWKSLKNFQWIYASIIVRFLKNYEHVTDPPTFDEMEAFTL